MRESNLVGEFECPGYNGDVEASEGLPKGANDLCKRLENADAFVVASPEYISLGQAHKAFDPSGGIADSPEAIREIRVLRHAGDSERRQSCLGSAPLNQRQSRRKTIRPAAIDART